MPKSFDNKKTIDVRFAVLAKVFLVTALLIFFIPLIILPFYNHPFADDYFCGYYLRSKGFLPYQIFIYKNWGGRFAATFTGSLFAYKNFVYHFYYLHSLLLLVFNFGSILFLVGTLNKYVLKTEFKSLKKLLFSTLFFTLEICSLAQVSTYIFWFSSAITYQLPVILIQIEIALFIILYSTDKNSIKFICAVLLPLFVFVSIGFNELFLIVQLFLFGLLFWLDIYKKIPLVFVLCIIALIAGSVLIFFAPGNNIRMHAIVSKSILTGLIAVIYHDAEILWNIFKTPLFWYTACAVFVYANNKKRSLESYLFIQKIISNKWRFLFLILLFLIASIALPVIGLKGGIIPERYVNAVICFTLILLLFYFFILGISQSNDFKTLYNFQSSVLYLLIGVCLLCNNYILDAYKSLIIAPVYDNILSEREAELKNASSDNKTATIKNYNAALSDLIQKKYSSSSATYLQLIQQKPPLLFFEDDLETESAISVLKNYYKLDSIKILKQ